jgi:L-alanine-DL-glutamate epimerase-like enolase superfamily enzyme
MYGEDGQGCQCAVRDSVATGERLTTKALPAARQGAARRLCNRPGRSGGIWETKKIAAIAEVPQRGMAPHLWRAEPVEWAANPTGCVDPQHLDGRND